MENLKECPECGATKDQSLFSKDKSRKSGYGAYCKECKNKRNKKYCENNKNKIQIYQENYREENKEKLATAKKEYYILNKEDIRQYRKDNEDKIKIYKKEYDKQYYQDNKETKREYNKKYDKQRRDNDPSYKLRKNVSRLINLALNKNNSSKNGLSCLEFLGYTIQELKDHLESLFEPWMNWPNHGVYRVETWDDSKPETFKWNIDHITAQSDLPYKTMEDENFKKCWALSNLRPYSAKQNLLDGNRR